MSKNHYYQRMELEIVNLFGKRKNIIIPNCFIEWGTATDHECDILIIKPSGYAIEVEIKMSVSDFKADMKKKHSHINEKLRQLYYAMPENVFDACKHDIPDYAGVLILYNYDNFERVKELKYAPKKEARKLTIEEQNKLMRTGIMKYWNLKESYHKEKSIY